MKLRVDSNRIRFRLSESEIDSLMDSHEVSQKLSINGKLGLSYAVSSSDVTSELQIFIEDHSLKLVVPILQLKSLTKNPSKEGISKVIDCDNHEMLISIQVENGC